MKIKILAVLTLTLASNVFPTISSNASTVFGYDKNVFISGTSFFLGAEKDATNTGTAALVRVRNLGNRIDFITHAHEKATVNGTSGADDPIYDNGISYLTYKSLLPIGVLKTDLTLGGTQKIFKSEAETFVLTTTQILRNADSVLTTSIFGILGDPTSHIFAAVGPATGNPFGASGTGVSLVVTQSGMLVPTDATTGFPYGNKAVKLSTDPADAMISITNTSTIEEIIDMQPAPGGFYLSVIARTSDSAGGVVSLMHGKVDSTSDPYNPYKLTLEPVVPAVAASFTGGSSDFIIGYNAVAVPPVSATYKIKGMVTSTFKGYVIVNGDVTAFNTEAKNKIYALPIVYSFDSADRGKIAKKTDFTQAAVTAADMTLKTDVEAIVGGGDLPNDSDQDVKGLHVIGDTVYVMLAGSTPLKAGIYQSTAILDSSGNVRKWTEWQRVMGSTEKVYGGGVDAGIGGFVFLTDDTLSYTNVVKATTWGKGTNDKLLGDLVDQLRNHFPQVYGGVQGLTDFSETTSSFRPVGVDGSLSVLAAIGLNKVVFVETGRQDGSTAEFIPNLNNFSNNTALSTDGSAPVVSAATRLMAISGGDLETIGPLNNCEISRAPLAGVTDNGWFFVSGYQGVAVLSEDNGNGWDTATNVGLGFGFTGITATMSFKQLGSLTNIRKIVCDGTNLYVLTSTSLVRIPLSAANFSTAGSAILPGAETIATLPSVTGGSSGVFYDLVVSSRLCLLATSKGLYRVSNDGNITSGSSGWTEVSVTDGTDTFSLGQVVHLMISSAKRGGLEEGGNLYATAADIGSNLATTYRFDVGDTRVVGGSAIDNNTVARITELGGEIYFFTFGNFRTLFRTDGTFLFNINSRHFGNTDFLKFSLMGDAPSKVGTTRGMSINLDVTSSAKDINLMVRNSASGAWIVPGDWGIRVNE